MMSTITKQTINYALQESAMLVTGATAAVSTTRQAEVAAAKHNGITNDAS